MSCSRLLWLLVGKKKVRCEAVVAGQLKYAGSWLMFLGCFGGKVCCYGYGELCDVAMERGNGNVDGNVVGFVEMVFGIWV